VEFELYLRLKRPNLHKFASSPMYPLGHLNTNLCAQP
jgi:hypothetical protein